MRQKGSSTGYVFFNKQRNKWNAQYYEYNVKTGISKPKTKSFDTEEEANKYLSTIMYQKENPIYIKNNGIPICEIMKSDLKLKYDTNQISATQFSRVSRTIQSVEKTKLGKKNIDDITTNELQEEMNSFKHLSNSSISKIYQLYSRAFKSAIDKGYLIRNPMANVIKPKSTKKDKIVRALTIDEQQAFTDYLLQKDLSKCRYRNVFLIQMYMGLRCGETLALTTHDIDLRSKTINVYRTLTMDENNQVIMGETTKTYAGKRTLPIPNQIYQYIIEQMRVAESKENNEEKLLFKPDNAKYTRRTNVNSELQRIMERQFGITDISTHSLRHTYGTRCIESGMAPVVVQKLMGHKDVSVTLNVYTTVLDKFKQAEIDKVNNYYMSENLIPSDEDKLLER